MGRAGGSLPPTGVAAAHEDASSEGGATGETVDPSHGVLPVLGGVAKTIQHGGETRHRRGLHHHPAALDGLEPERHLGDEPGQPHAADGGEEELPLAMGAAFHLAAVGDLDDQPLHERAEGAVAVMVLAVHVARDTAPDGDEPRSRGDRRKPPPRQKDPHDLVEGKSGLARESSRARVEGEHPVGAHRLEHARARGGGHGRVTVGATEPAGQDGANRPRGRRSRSGRATVPRVTG